MTKHVLSIASFQCLHAPISSKPLTIAACCYRCVPQPAARGGVVPGGVVHRERHDNGCRVLAVAGHRTARPRAAIPPGDACRLAGTTRFQLRQLGGIHLVNSVYAKWWL